MGSGKNIKKENTTRCVVLALPVSLFAYAWVGLFTKVETGCAPTRVRFSFLVCLFCLCYFRVSSLKLKLVNFSLDWNAIFYQMILRWRGSALSDRHWVSFVLNKFPLAHPSAFQYCKSDDSTAYRTVCRNHTSACRTCCELSIPSMNDLSYASSFMERKPWRIFSRVDWLTHELLWSCKLSCCNQGRAGIWALCWYWHSLGNILSQTYIIGCMSRLYVAIMQYASVHLLLTVSSTAQFVLCVELMNLQISWIRVA